jgi:heparin/heparan-sulfate lyase
MSFIIAVLIVSLLSQTGCVAAEPCRHKTPNDISAPVTIPDPPRGHPRLYLTQDDIPDVRRRVESPQGQKIIRALEKAGQDRTPQEEAAETDRGFRYYFKMRGVTSRAQIHALNYLLDNDPEEARTAITEMLDTLRKTRFGTKNDLSRASGVMIMVGSMVYDWCYDRMSPAERESYIKEFIRIAGTMECGYPPKRNEYLAGHGSEWMILRDLLSAGIAVYDEYPDLYNYVRQMLQEDYIPVRNYIYKGGNQFQGSSYANVRLSNDFISLWILDRMGARNLYVPEMKDVMYDFIYRRRPDGLVLPAGDVNHIRGRGDSYALPAMLASSYFKDEYIAKEWEFKPSVEPHCLMFRLLWQDFSLTGRSPDSLPLTRFSGTPFGWMISRTGWGDDSVIAEMKVNEQFAGNHQHLDGGSFQIYYKGPLAIDSGIYQTVQGGYNSANNKNYTKRTIAHNSLLVYDPSEVFESYNYGGADKTPTVNNDGGQRCAGKGWDTCRSFSDLLGQEFTVGKTLGHWAGPDARKPRFSYLMGDITRAYSAKVRDVRRSFVFINMERSDIPAVMVIYDHVVSSDPSFKKFWLLHSIEEPDIQGNTFTVSRTRDGDTGMLQCRCLLPGNATVEKVGGPGKEFWVFGTNYPADPQPNRPDVAGERGAWRVEISPGTPSAEDCFLNVIQVSQSGRTNFLETGKILSDNVAGVVVGGKAVTFSKDGSAVEKGFSLSLPRTETAEYETLLTGLAPGKWQVVKGGKTVLNFTVNPEEGCAAIKLAAGEYTVKSR